MAVQLEEQHDSGTPITIKIYFEIPNFYGRSSVRVWVKQCEKCFSLLETPNEQKVDLAYMCVFDKAYVWARDYIGNNLDVEWPEFARDLCDKFGTKIRGDIREREEKEFKEWEDCLEKYFSDRIQDNEDFFNNNMEHMEKGEIDAMVEVMEQKSKGESITWLEENMNKMMQVIKEEHEVLKEAIDLPDAMEIAGAVLIREVASKTNDSAGVTVIKVDAETELELEDRKLRIESEIGELLGTAAVIAFGLDEKSTSVGAKNVFIFDPGGGTFNVSLLTIEEDNQPGVLIQVFEGEILDRSWSEFQHLLLSSMDKIVRLWHLASKSRLKTFSHSDYVTCIQFNLVDDRFFISGSLDAKVRIWSIPDQQVVDWNDLHEMVTADCYTSDGQAALVGSYKGSCRLYNTSEHKLQQKTRINLQNKKKKGRHKNITGFQFAPGSTSEVQYLLLILLLDVTPLSLGLETAGGVQVVEGERTRTRDNNLFGKFELSGIPPAPRGVLHDIDVNSIDVNSILNVSAQDKTTGQKNKSIITNDEGRLPKDEIEMMVQEAEKYRFEDEKHKKTVDAKISFENHAYNMKMEATIISEMSVLVFDPGGADSSIICW